jgi:hypothetical protein
MRIRNTHPAFNGKFTLVTGDDHEVIMRWQLKEHIITLNVNLRDKSYSIDDNTDRLQ